MLACADIEEGVLLREAGVTVPGQIGILGFNDIAMSSWPSYCLTTIRQPIGDIISAAVDIACWDIVGKAAGLPLFRLFGGYRDEVPAYVTCGYYREGKDNAELRDEMQMLVEQGHTGFKAKAGGIPVPQDVERMAVMREVIGDAADFMIDPNRAWDLPTAIDAAQRAIIRSRVLSATPPAAWCSCWTSSSSTSSCSSCSCGSRGGTRTAATRRAGTRSRRPSPTTNSTRSPSSSLRTSRAPRRSARARLHPRTPSRRS